MYFILTAKSFLWVALSIVSTITLFAAIQSPKWIVSPLPYNCSSVKLQLETVDYNNTKSNYDVRIYPSIGIYYWNTQIDNQSCGSFVDQGLDADLSRLPIAWKIALVFMSAGIFINFLMAIMAVGSFCKQSIGKKSVFGVAGAGQGLAGLLYLIGVIGFAAGWGAKCVMDLCGAQTEPFVSADCTNGSGLYTAALGIFLTFVTAMLSGPADQATSSDKVALQLEQGENVVFLL